MLSFKSSVFSKQSLKMKIFPFECQLVKKIEMNKLSGGVWKQENRLYKVLYEVII